MPSIYCSINGYNFYKTTCDTGSGVNIMAAVTNRHLFQTMPLKPTYIQLQMADQTFREVKGIVTDVPVKIDDHFVYTGTREVHMQFHSDKVRRYFSDPNYIVDDSKQVRRRRNRNQRSQIINDGWADYEGEVVRWEDIQFKHNYPEETVAPSYVWKEKITIHEEEAPPEVPTTPPNESQDNWENGESRSEDLKTPNALSTGKLGSYLLS